MNCRHFGEFKDKLNVVKRDQVDHTHTKTERSVLEAVSHPFIVNFVDEHKLIVRSGLALVHVTCDMAFVGSRQLSCLKTSWIYQFFNEIWKMENRLWSSCRLTS